MKNIAMETYNLVPIYEELRRAFGNIATAKRKAKAKYQQWEKLVKDFRSVKRNRWEIPPGWMDLQVKCKGMELIYIGNIGLLSGLIHPIKKPGYYARVRTEAGNDIFVKI